MTTPSRSRRTLTVHNLLVRIDERLLLMLIGLVVGCCAGLAAVLLNRSILALEHALLSFRHLWWAFILPGCGAALSSLFLTKIAREEAGHGVPEIIYSVSRSGGRLRSRSSFTRLISSCLTIGSGGSAGPEAPIVMSGASIGSHIASYLRLNDRHRTVLVGCGSAAAISAIFNAPIAGIVFTMEVILGEWAAVNIVPIAIASVAGTELSRALQGNQIPFGHDPFTISLPDIIATVGLAVVAAAASIALTHLLRASHQAWERLRLPVWVRAALGGCAVGAIGLLAPVVLGEGYHAIREMISGSFETGVLLVALAVVLKIVATSLTIGSGGSGGIFAPCLVVGSLVGLVYHRLVSALWPSLILVPEGCFALLGMAGLISGMLQAPLTGIFLIVEITGGYGVILPLIVVSMVATTVCNKLESSSFYLKDLIGQGHLLRPRTDARVLADLSVNELLEHDCVTVSESMRLGQLVEIIKQSRRNYFPVEDQHGRFVGMIHLDDVRSYLFTPELYDAVVLAELMDPDPEVVGLHEDLAEVLERMDRLQRFSLPVVTDNRFVGMISKATLLDTYRRELIVQTE
jgi:CIC family chloride channel protein